MTTHGQLHGAQPRVIDRRPAYDSTPVEPAPPKPFTATPLGDYIVVRRIPEPEGLIVEPDVAKDKPLECEVLAVSSAIKKVRYYVEPDKLTSPVKVEPILKAGDKVLIRRYSGTEVKVDGQEVTLILIQDVLLKL